jgi:hypothetical protein
MDVIAAAVALVAPYLAKAAEGFASRAGEAAIDGTKALLRAIRDKFADDRDEYASQTLTRLEERPDDEARQAALRAVLADKASQDADFAYELRQLVGQTTQGAPLNSFLTQVYGGDVGKIVNVGTTGTLNIS